jgi:tetratricopeptide (TPR) repeat protein
MIIDVPTSDFLEKLLKSDIESLSKEDRDRLVVDRQEVIHCLITLFSKEISSLQKDNTCENPRALFFGLHLAGLLEISEAFEWLHNLCHLPDDMIEEYLGIDFITEDLPHLLASTMSRWEELKSEIENPALSEFIRSSCLNALVFASAKGRIERLEIIHYFKSLFLRILNGDLDDISFITDLVSSCCDLWPGECLEEIKEVFGLDLIDEFFCDISSVYEDLAKGKEYCIKRLQEQVKQSNFWEPLLPSGLLHQENSFKKRIPSLEAVDQAKEEATQILEELSIQKPQRNEPCFCGSGKKYKKCCSGKNTSPIFADKLRIEASTISYGPRECPESMQGLPAEEKSAILGLYPLVKKDPEKVLEQAPVYISKYKNIPLIYNYLYCAYRRLDRNREALSLLKETLKQFPDYLFARVEYSLYLLRRGEREEAHSVLGNAETLSQLYPDRKAFHVVEWVAFAYTTGLYYVQKDELKQAKLYLELIQQISPQCREISELREKIKSQAFRNAFFKASGPFN